MQYLLLVVAVGLGLVVWRNLNHVTRQDNGNGGTSWKDWVKTHMPGMPKYELSAPWKNSLLAISGWFFFQVSIAFLSPDMWGKITPTAFWLGNFAAAMLALNHALGGPKWLRWPIAGPVALSLAVSLWPMAKDFFPAAPRAAVNVVENRCGKNYLTKAEQNWRVVRVPVNCEMIFTPLSEGKKVLVRINGDKIFSDCKGCSNDYGRFVKKFEFRSAGAMEVPVSIEYEPLRR